MCDTIIATPEATKDGVMLFGKNSDREADEAQNLVIIPAADHNPKEELHCTYITIPQVSHTHRIIISQPFWMFGAEIGMNEHGVVIGNEALITKVKPAETGLTGMDLLRLALERSNTAEKARDTIISLLEKYGQGGRCGYRDTLYYMNGFLIADSKAAYVLETVDKHWAWKQIHGIWSISNKISIEHDYDAISEHLIDDTIQKGWCHSVEDFNFSQNYTNKLITWGAAGHRREQINRCYLANHDKKLTLSDFLTMLRSHTDDPAWKPHQGLRMTVCAHAANNLTKHTQTTNTLLAQIAPERFHCFSTGASNPCLSPVFPVFSPNTQLPSDYHKGNELFEETAFWWRSERVHRKAVLNFAATTKIIAPAIEKYESQMLKQVLPNQNPLTQAEIDQYFSTVQTLLHDWEQALAHVAAASPWWLRRFWAKYNRLNKVIPL
jgi:secernin